MDSGLDRNPLIPADKRRVKRDSAEERKKAVDKFLSELDNVLDPEVQ